MIDGHGDDLYKYGIDVLKANFSSNIYGPTNNQALKEHLIRSISVIDSYPEPEPYSLQERLAEKLHVDKSNVIAFSGATDAIYTIANVLGSNSVNVVVQPTFSEYTDALNHVGAKVYNVSSFKEGANLISCFRLDAFWFCNPNNPTGQVIPLAEIKALAKRCSNTLFIIDQSYASFTAEDVFRDEDINTFDNILILHSLTKAYKLPGLRLGYAVTQNRLILQKYGAFRMPWSVNALAIEAGMFVTKDEEWNKRTFDLGVLLSEAKALRDGLIALGLEVEPTNTHFMLCKISDKHSITSQELKNKLVSQFGLLVRDASNFHGLSNKHFRVAAQDASSNSLLLNAIKQVLK